MQNKTTLANGVRVISEEIDAARSVSIGVWVESGSRFEEASQNGTAHFIEHMLFKGTQRRSAFDIASAIDSVGGVLNAYTSKELTSFYVKVPDYHLSLAIDLLADIFTASRFDDEEIVKEKSVILQEISMLEDTPDDYIHDVFDAAFWPGHGLGRPVLGTRESVSGFSRESLRQFFRQRYCPDNLILTAAGRLDSQSLVRLAETGFGALTGKAVGAADPSTASTASLTVLEKDLEQVHLLLGTPSPSSVDESRYAAYILNAVLGGSMSSRLFQEIRERRGLAYSVSSYLTPYKDTGTLNVYAGTSRADAGKVLGLICDELRRICDTPLPPEELTSAKEMIKGSFLLSMESTDTRMTRLAKNEIHFGRQIPPEDLALHVDAVTAEDVLAMARKILNPSDIAVAAIGPVSEKKLSRALVAGC